MTQIRGCKWKAQPALLLSNDYSNLIHLAAVNDSASRNHLLINSSEMKLLWISTVLMCAPVFPLWASVIE